MGTKIFLLVNGPVEEPCNVAAFSTREAAEAAIRLGGWECAIEELDLDPPLPVGPEGQTLWGLVWERGEEPGAIPALYAHVSHLGEVRYELDTYEVDLWATDEAHALKLGLERIEQYKKMQGLGA